MTSYNPFSLEGKTVLVTGASSGIGRETAIVCSKMGAKVAVTGRNEMRLNDTFSMLEGEGHCQFVADLTELPQIENISVKMPVLDGVVHCAGIGDRTSLKLVKEKDISKVMRVNFEAPVLLQKELLKEKKIRLGGSIVFVASRAASIPTLGNGLYSASKGALIAYAKTLSLELATKKIRVNSICPAMVWTELIEKDAALMGVDYHEAEKSYPLKRYGRPEDIANLSVYLLSDASCWMTGSSIDITGGALTL